MCRLIFTKVDIVSWDLSFQIAEEIFLQLSEKIPSGKPENKGEKVMSKLGFVLVNSKWLKIIILLKASL